MSAPKISRRGTVRGIARRVVIVPQPDGGAFEQAIFIVRGDCAVTETELLRQALEAAGAETAPPARQRPSLRRRLRRVLPWLLATSALLAAASTVWLIF